ncbi:MAG: hypothetical protein SangKO_011020 [Sandaracinaceae bacterium]
MDEDYEDEGARSFTRALEMVADGDLVIDASAELFELNQALRREARIRRVAVKGTFTLKLQLVVEPNGPVEIHPSITTKRADRKTARGLLWLTPGGNLTAENPRQQNLPLREVAMGDDEPRDVGSDRNVREV